MATVLLDMAISLDGFIGGPNGTDIGLYNWYFAPDPAPTDAAMVAELIANTGAIVMGRRAYGSGEEADGYNDNPYRVPHFIITHTPPANPHQGDTEFIFVTDGLASAIQQARAAAGSREVSVGGGANVARQLLQAGLIDEIQLHIVPLIAGDGIRLFDVGTLSALPLEQTRVIVSPAVTHIRYRVRR